MTSTEEVPRIPSIGARQAEPPAPQNGRVHVFSRGGTILQQSLMGVFLAQNEKNGCPSVLMAHGSTPTEIRWGAWLCEQVPGYHWICGLDKYGYLTLIP